MKKCIFLKQEYIEPSKLKKIKLDVAQDKQFRQTLLLFKEQMKEVIKAFKIIKELSPDSIIIEYVEVMDDKMLEMLRAADIVETIDSMIPIKRSKIEIDVDDDRQAILKLKNKMAKYKK